jgi:hypothetical protein
VKLLAGHRGPFGKQKLVRKNFKLYTKTSSRNTDLFEKLLAAHKEQFQKHRPVREIFLAVHKETSSRNTDLFERNF